jgi:hypothetical protein
MRPTAHRCLISTCCWSADPSPGPASWPTTSATSAGPYRSPSGSSSPGPGGFVEPMRIMDQAQQRSLLRHLGHQSERNQEPVMGAARPTGPHRRPDEAPPPCDQESGRAGQDGPQQLVQTRERELGLRLHTIETEVSATIGAQPWEHTPSRTNQRPGSRPVPVHDRRTHYSQSATSKWVGTFSARGAVHGANWSRTGPTGQSQWSVGEP